MSEIKDIRMTKEEILSALESEFRSEFGNDIDLTESSVFSTFGEVLSTVLSQNQEQSLQEVYESGFLDTAEGPDLDRVVAIVGIQRRSAIHATGVQRFMSSDPVTTDYTIQKGTTVQTEGDDPKYYETSETTKLEYIDGFEDGNLDSSYEGDTGSASVVSIHPSVGSYELQLDATAGAHVYSDSKIEEGTTMDFDVYPESATVPIVTFGVQDVNNHYQVSVDSDLGEVRLEKVEGGSVSKTIDSVGVSIPTGEHSHVEIDWNVTGHIGVSVQNGGNEIATVGGYDSQDYTNRWSDGFVGFKSGDANAAKYFDEATTSAVSANIRAKSGGERSNVGSNSITSMPSPPSGVHDTTNLYAVGDPDNVDKNGEQFRIGQPEESDDKLRQRAKDSVSSGGHATVDSIVSALLNEVDNVRSVNIYENKTDNDNTGSGGLPPYSFEAVVHGGDDYDVAETIYNKKAATSRDYGGSHGTAVTKTIQSEVNGQQFDITFSRPSSLSITITTDLVVDDTYVGDEEIKNAIVSYIGGVDTVGANVVGLGVGEDVHMDQVEKIIVGDDNGVIGFDMNASSYEIDTSPSTTTSSNGLEIIDVGSNEVPNIDASNITINTKQV